MLLTIELTEAEIEAVKSKAATIGTDDLGEVVRQALARFEPPAQDAVENHGGSSNHG